MRGVLLTGFVASVLLLAPAEGSAKRLGPDLDAYPPTSQIACASEPFCTRAQIRLGGDPVKAPFSGELRKWRVIHPNGSLWLQVLRKRGDGSYKSVRSGQHHTVTSASGEVVRFGESLHIRRGDYIGVGADEFYSSSFSSHFGPGQGNCMKGFVPGLADGESGFPNPSFGACGAVLLYNAVLQR